MTDNIVFKCYYYKPKEKYNPEKSAKEIQKRDFVSCNGSYNYLSYVDTGAENKLPKDYAEYVGNTEKSCGVFNKSNHAFIDGNKRIGILVMLSFLAINGVQLKYTDDELIEIGISLASDKMSYSELLLWIKNHKVNQKLNSQEDQMEY